MSRLPLTFKSPQDFQLGRLSYKRLKTIMHLGLYLIGISNYDFIFFLVSLLFYPMVFNFIGQNLNRYLRRDMRFHLNKIPCNVALVKDDLSVDIWKSQNANDKIAETKPVYSLSKFVSLSDCHSMQDIEQSIISCKSYPHSLASSDSSGTIKSYSMHSYANSSLHSGSSSKHERSGQDPFRKFLTFS